ncbi:conserved Plasmodium protein, unknown function [Plasmodium ovale]|uniref:Uncharacterized protein n=1 Tax=Plasmodium ovale TaxID=36330 RepID=A0A1C3KQX5_PLAOA|nr:conserved Plasmodium protein, unknown function [Plasmodium ovale]
MGNCKSYSSHFNVCKNSTNEYYENLICNFVKEDNLSFCQKAFVIYEFLKKKPENKDEYVYYIVSNVQRKRVKNAMAYLNEDYNIDILNFLLKLFKKINNEYYNNANNLHFNSYYNYFLRENTKFANFSEQMHIIQKIYNFVRLKFILENICMHVYFELEDNSKEFYDMNNYFENKNWNNNELVKEKSSEFFQHNKNIMNMSGEKKKMMYSVKNHFKKIDNFCRNNIHCSIFDNFKMSNVISLYILNNQYKMKCILYNIFTILFFINNYYSMFSIDNNLNKSGKKEIREHLPNESSSKRKNIFNDKLKYTLEHRNVYITYLFVSLCLSFDKKIEEDVLFNTNIHINQNEVNFIQYVNEFLDICTFSQKKINKFFSQEVKEKNIYHCSLKTIKNVYINDSLINSHFICHNQYVKSIINIGNSNYLINNQMILFFFVLFENSDYAFSRASSIKSNMDNDNDNFIFQINNNLFRRGNLMNEEKLTLRKKLWQKFLPSKNYTQNYSNCNEDENKSDVRETHSVNSDFKKMDYMEFDLNNVGFFRIDLHNLTSECKKNIHENVDNYIKLYDIKKYNNNYIYVKKKIENKVDYQLVETMKNNSIHIINVLKTMRNKEICFIYPVSDYDDVSDKAKKEKKINVNSTDVKPRSNANSAKSKSTDKSFKKEREENISLITKNCVHSVNSESKNYICEENNSGNLKEPVVCKKKVFQLKAENKLKKPFFIGVHDIFVPFEMEKLILKSTNFTTADEEIIRKQKINLCKETHKHTRVNTRTDADDALREKEKRGEGKNEQTIIEREMGRAEAEVKKGKRIPHRESDDESEGEGEGEGENESESDYTHEGSVNWKGEQEKAFRESSRVGKNPCALNCNKTLERRNMCERTGEMINGNNHAQNTEQLESVLGKFHRKIKHNDDLQINSSQHSEEVSLANRKLLQHMEEVVNYSNVDREKKKKREESRRGKEEGKKSDRQREPHKDQEEREENNLNTEKRDVEICDEEIQQKGSDDTLKVLIQHKPIGEMCFFVNNIYININFSMFKIHNGRKKLLFSTYTNSEEVDIKDNVEDVNAEKVNYKITLNKNESFKYVIDLLFLHLNYNRLYFVFIPRRLIHANNSKSENNLFLNLMCCNCDIVIENLCIMPSDSSRISLVNTHIPIYFEKINFIKLVLFLLMDLIKVHNKIKKVQHCFEGKCKEFMKTFYDYISTKLKKINYDFGKQKKPRKVLSITNDLLKKTSTKKSDQQSLLSNDLNVSSSVKRYSNVSEKYISTKEDNNADKKSLIINMSSTLNSEICTNNMNNTNNIHMNNNNNEEEEPTNTFNNYYLNKLNSENPLDIGYKYKNIYIKIIDLKLYEFLTDYINYIKENNSCYYLCPYIFVQNFRGLYFLFIPVCNNFYLNFYLFFFHFLNCSDFFNFKRCFSRCINDEDVSKMNFNPSSNNNFLYINNIINILSIHKNSKLYVKYNSLFKEIQNSNNDYHYYKWKKNKIVIDIRSSFSSPHFIRTKSFVNFIESTNLHINLKKLYLNKDYMFSLKLDKKTKPPNENCSNVNDIVFMFNYHFNIYTYFYDEKKGGSNKELFRHSRYIIIPYFKDIYINRNNLHTYLKTLEDASTTDTFSDKTFFNEDHKTTCGTYDKIRDSSNTNDDNDGDAATGNKSVNKEEHVKNCKYSFIHNLYENYGDIFINYFYILLNKLMVEVVNEMKLNNFLSIKNFFQVLKKYEVDFDIYFWVLYDNYINVYKKYCAHAELVKFFNNNNRNETYDFDYLKKIKYNYCNKKKFYIRRILIFSVCILLSFICKSILDFFVTNLNCSYEDVFSTICFFFFSNSKQRKANDYLYLNLLKSIYFNLFFSLSFVLQYIPLTVQYLNLFKIIRKVKKYKIILAICLNYICGINLPFYIFYELQYMPLSLLNDFFSFDKEILNLCTNSYELSNSININDFEENYYDEADLKMNEKDNIEWVNENFNGYNISKDSLHFLKNKKMNKSIYKRFHSKAEKNKNLNLIRLMIKLHFNSSLNVFTFYDFKNASNNILSYLTNSGLQHFKSSNNNGDFFQLIFLHFVNFVSLFGNKGMYEMSENENSKNSISCLNHEMKNAENLTTTEMLSKHFVEKTSDDCDKTSENLKEADVLLKYCNLFNLSTDLLFSSQHQLMEKSIFHVLLNIIETHYSHLLSVLPIFIKENFKLLTYDLKIYLINIFFYIFIRTDKYKIQNVNNKKKNKISKFVKISKNSFTKQKDNGEFQFNKKDDILNNTHSENFFMNSYDYSTNNYFEMIKKGSNCFLNDHGINDDTDEANENSCEFRQDVTKSDSETECESENKTEIEYEAETQTETETDIEGGSNRNAKEDMTRENGKKLPRNFRERIKIILLDNDYNFYLIEFFFKIVLRIIPFFKLKNKNANAIKSTIIYNVKIILSSLKSFKNVILSMKNNFYVFIYYFFIKGYISLILLNVHRALKHFKKVFVLIVFFFGNPINSLNNHPFLIYVTYILYVLTLLSKLNLVNFYEHIIKKEKREINDDGQQKTCKHYSNNVGDNNSNINNDNSSNCDEVERGQEMKSSTFFSEDKSCTNNVWLKQKYEVLMHLEIIRTIKRKYVKFNNNIYLVPLNYFFINMKKLFKKYLEEKRFQKFGDVDDNDVLDKNLKKKNKKNEMKKEKNYDNSTGKEININDKLEDKNLLINMNNNFVALYPTSKNVNVPKVYLRGDIDKSFISSADFEKKANSHESKFSIEMKNRNSKEADEVKYEHGEAEQTQAEQREQKEAQSERERQRKKKTHTFINSKTSLSCFVEDQADTKKDKYTKLLYGRVDKKDLSNLLLYNIIYINKMNRKLNNCKFVCFNFKYYNYKKIISDYNKYYKIILETFKRKLCENYYAYTFGNNENGSLAIGRPSYLKLSPTIGSIGDEKNKKSIKKGTDFWFTNNLQLIPIKIKKVCMNEGMISIIDKKHNLYIGGENILVETRNELYVKDKNVNLRGKEKKKTKDNSIKRNEKIEIDKFFTNLRLKEIKKQENDFINYNSSSGDSDNLLFGNSPTYEEPMNFLKPFLQCEKLIEFYKNAEDKNKVMCNCTSCASLNIITHNFSSCESDVYSSFDSDDSNITYVKVTNIDEINKNMNINMMLNSNKDKSFYVKKKNYSLKKISIDDFNIFNSILYSSSYANQYLAYVLPDQKSSIKSAKKYFKQISNEFYRERLSSKLKCQTKENIEEEKRNSDQYKYSKVKHLHEEQKKNSKGSCKKNSLSTKGKNERTLLDNNLNNNKFIYNFIHDIKSRIKFIDIYNGADFVISINNFGHVYAWGNNKYGCLGTGDNINRYAPTLINPGHFFLYDFEKLQIHTNYKTEIKIKGSEKIDSRLCENILYNSLIIETIKKNIYNKNKNPQNVLKETTQKCNEIDGKSINSSNFPNPSKHKDEDFFTLKTNNIYTSEHMFNFENLEIKNVVISVHKIYVPISSIFCGNNHVCAYSNGSIFMWGEQKLGQTSIPFQNIYFDCFNKCEFSDSDSNTNYKKKKKEKRDSRKNKISELLSTSSSPSSESYYFNVIDKKKIENIKNKFNKNKFPFCKKKFTFNVENAIQNSFSITNNSILLNNRKLKLCTNLNSMNNIKKKKNNNNLVLVPIQVCLFNLSYRVKRNESNLDDKLSHIDSVETRDSNMQNLMNLGYNLHNFQGNDDNDGDKGDINISQKKKTEAENTNLQEKNKYIRIFDYLETFIKAEVVNIYMSLFRNDINIYTNIPNNSNINPYIYGMNFYDYNFYDEKYTNVQDYYDISRKKREFTDSNNTNLYFSSENYYNAPQNVTNKLNEEKHAEEKENDMSNSQKNIDLLNIDDPNKFVKLMKEDEVINPKIYEYIEKEETVCINIKLIVFLFLFIKKKYMTIFMNNILMVTNISCGEANTVITCFKKSIYDKYYQYIMKNITCSDNYKHMENEKMKSKVNESIPENYFSSVTEASDFIYRNDIYDIKNYTSTIVNWGDKSFDEFKLMNSTYSCSDTSRLYRMIEEILAHYMCIYVCGRDTNNNLCLNNINQSVYTFTRITNNFFYYNFNNFLYLYKYNYYLYYIHKNNVHINHNNDITYIQNNPLTSFKNIFNTFTTKENSANVTNHKTQGTSPNQFIIIKKIVCSNIVTCLLDTRNNIYVAGDLKHYFPNYFRHIAYGSSPFVKINLNNKKTIKNISISQNNIFLIYDDHSIKILGYNDYIDFFTHNHPIFFTNKHNQKLAYSMLTIRNSDFLVKEVQTGNNCAVFVMKKKKGKKNPKK